MSGGSFEYLYAAEPEDIAAGLRGEWIAYIRRYLAENFPGDEVLLDPMIERIAEARVAYEAAVERARFTPEERDLLQALEWYASSDWGEDRVKAVIERMKNGRTG